jgi:hypothetical protein
MTRVYSVASLHYSELSVITLCKDILLLMQRVFSIVEYNH